MPSSHSKFLRSGAKTDPSASSSDDHSSSMPHTVDLPDTDQHEPGSQVDNEYLSPISNIGGTDNASILSDFTISTQKTHYSIPQDLREKDVTFSLRSPFTILNEELDFSPSDFVDAEGNLLSVKNLVPFLAQEFTARLPIGIGIVQRTIIRNEFNNHEFRLYGLKRGKMVNIHSSTSFMKYIRVMLEKSQNPHIFIDLQDDVYNVTREKMNLTDVTDSKPPSRASEKSGSHIHVESTDGELRAKHRSTYVPGPSKHTGSNHFVPPSSYNRAPPPTRPSQLHQNVSRPSTDTQVSVPLVPTPVDKKLLTLGRNEFDSRKFAQFMLNHVLKEDSERGLRNFYRGMGQAVEYGLKGGDQIFPDLDHDLTRVVTINDLLLDDRDKHHPYYNQAVDNVNAIQRQVYNVLTNNVNIPSTMDKAWLVIERFSMSIQDGFELLMVLLREFFPHLGGPPLEVSKEIVQMIVEKGDTLQTYYARTLALDSKLLSSQQLLPMNDLVTIFLECLMCTPKLEMRLQQVHSALVTHKLRAPNTPFSQTIHSIYRDLELAGVDTDMQLTVCSPVFVNSSSMAEANVSELPQEDVIQLIRDMPSEIVAMMASGLKKDGVITARPSRSTIRCAACGGRHPTNRCFLLGFVPHQLQAKIDRYKTMYPNLKPDEEHMNKKYPPPPASKAANSSSVRVTEEEVEQLANYTDTCLPCAFAGEVPSIDDSPTHESYDTPNPEDPLAMNSEVEKYLVDFDEETQQFDYVRQI